MMKEMFRKLTNKNRNIIMEARANKVVFKLPLVVNETATQAKAHEGLDSSNSKEH